MTTAELLLQDYDMEMASSRRVLERVPEGLPDFKCHDKSAPLGKLAMHVATLPAFGIKILTTPGMNMADPATKWPDQTFSTREHSLAVFDAAAKSCRAALVASSDSALAEHWKFSLPAHVLQPPDPPPGAA